MTVTTTEPDTLDPYELSVLAEQINIRLNRAERDDDIAGSYRQSAERKRIEAGKMLLKAKRLIEAPGGNIAWSEWCRANIERSEQDIRRLLRIALADDPEAEAERQRAIAREGMVRTRAKRTNAETVSSDDPTEGDFPAALAGMPSLVRRYLERMNAEQCGALISWLVQREGGFRRAQQSAEAKVVPLRA
jgi:hypothetical protein